MTLPKRLQEKRDELVLEGFDEQDLLLMSIDIVGSEEDSDGHKYAADFRIGFRYGYRRGIKKGFNDCAKIILPEIEKLKSTIDCAAKYLESCGYNDVDQSEPELQMLQSFYKAMQSLEEFLGDKSEGDNET